MAEEYDRSSNISKKEVDEDALSDSKEAESKPDNRGIPRSDQDKITDPTKKDSDISDNLVQDRSDETHDGNKLPGVENTSSSSQDKAPEQTTRKHHRTSIKEDNNFITSLNREKTIIPADEDALPDDEEEKEGDK